MTEHGKFERAVAALQEAALREAEWPRAAALVNEATSASGHSLVYADPPAARHASPPPILTARFFAGAERREDWERWYFADYLLRDEAIPRHVALGDGEVAHIPDLYTDADRRHSAAYNEFRLATKSSKGLLLKLGGPEPATISWGLADSLEPGGWSNGQIETVKALAPHVRHFVRVRYALAGAAALGSTLAELLDGSGLGIIHLDRRGRIVTANDRAARILRERDGLRDEAGVLRAATPGEDAELQASLSRALPAPGVRSVGAGQALKIERRRNPAPLVIQVHPLDSGYTETVFAARPGDVLVVVADASAKARIDPGVVARVFGLTPAESRIAVLLAGGDTVATIAVKLNVAESTVRSHVRKIFRQAGVSKQTELVRRLLSLAAVR